MPAQTTETHDPDALQAEFLALLTTLSPPKPVDPMVAAPVPIDVHPPISLVVAGWLDSAIDSPNTKRCYQATPQRGWRLRHATPCYATVEPTALSHRRA